MLQRTLNPFQDKLSELEVQQINLEELIATLRDSSAGSATARLTEWHSKLGELRLVERRLIRSNQQLHEKVRHLEELVSSSERAFTKLEQELVTVTKVSTYTWVLFTFREENSASCNITEI